MRLKEMKHKAIEPSEIITELHRHKGKKQQLSQPFIRFLARFFDYSLLLLCLLGVRHFLGRYFPSSLFEYVIPFEFFIWIPIESLFLSCLGTTPGKFFLKVKLHQGRKPKLNFTSAIRRSFYVWFRGIGMGIPILNLFCMAVAAQRLKMLGQTSWDREDNISVVHESVHRWRIIVSFLLVISVFFIYYSK